MDHTIESLKDDIERLGGLLAEASDKLANYRAVHRQELPGRRYADLQLHINAVLARYGMDHIRSLDPPPAYSGGR